MDILSILRNQDQVFIEDEVEDKKVKALVASVNENLKNSIIEIDAFKNFEASQLAGEYHEKLVLAKSLAEVYSSWPAVAAAYENLRKEETKAVNDFYAAKKKTIDSLNELAKVSAKAPVVSAYDVFEGDLVKCEEGHNVIILGSHNTDIIATIVNTLETELQVAGHFDELQSRTLTANYSVVQKNVSNCEQALNEMFGNKAGKLQKFMDVVNKLEDMGQKAVFFLTYKNDLLSIGCASKELDIYEKNLEKNYIPLKKLLQKTCKFKLEDICDITIDEDSFVTADEENIEATFVNEEAVDSVYDNANSFVQYTQEAVDGEPFGFEEMQPASETFDRSAEFTHEEVAPMDYAPVYEAEAPVYEQFTAPEEFVAPVEETVAPTEEVVAPAEEVVAPKKFDFKGLANRINANKPDEDGEQQ